MKDTQVMAERQLKVNGRGAFLRLGRFGALSGVLALWCDLGRSAAFWGALGRPGAFWSVVGRSGALWGVLARSGCVGAF